MADLARRESDGDEAASPAQGAEGMLGVGSTHRVHHHVGSAVGDLFDPRLEVLGAVVDPDLGSMLEAQGQLVGGRRRGQHPGAECRPQLDGGQSHPSRGPEDNGPLPRLHPGHAPQRVVGGLMGHPGGRRRGQVDCGVDRLEGRGRHRDLLGKRPEQGRAHHPVADGEAVDADPDRADGACELASHRKGERNGDLIAVGHHQYVGEVDGGGGHVHHHLSLGGDGSSTSSTTTEPGGP